jgi:hypothetical protein
MVIVTILSAGIKPSVEGGSRFFKVGGTMNKSPEKLWLRSRISPGS